MDSVEVDFAERELALRERELEQRRIEARDTRASSWRSIIWAGAALVVTQVVVLVGIFVQSNRDDESYLLTQRRVAYSKLHDAATAEFRRAIGARRALDRGAAEVITPQDFEAYFEVCSQAATDVRLLGPSEIADLAETLGGSCRAVQHTTKHSLRKGSVVNRKDMLAARRVLRADINVFISQAESTLN
ncbi:hypothetical protein [Nocardioides sp. MH1]|uniref:hypothetical protein n=1 Tax=Nocardioides sp. MH1 TaxID=3242490 RepID=UPI003521535F